MKKTIRVVGVASLLCCQSVNAMSEKDWDVLTDIGTYGLVATAAAVPAYKGDWEGFWQAGLSIGTASGVGLIGKKTIDAERQIKVTTTAFHPTTLQTHLLLRPTFTCVMDGKPDFLHTAWQR